MVFLAFFLSLATKVLCFFFSLNICAEPTCQDSRRVNVRIGRTFQTSQELGIRAFCDQSGTTLDNIDSDNSPLVELLRDTSNSCTLVNGTSDLPGGTNNLLELPTRQFNALQIDCFTEAADDPIDIDFCCPEEDSVAVVIASLVTNSAPFTLEALAVVSDEPPEFQAAPGECESMLKPSQVKCESSPFDIPAFAVLFKF